MLPLCCLVDFHLGRHVPVAEITKTHRALDAAPLSKVAVCWAQCLVPDLTSFRVWNIQEWLIWHSFVGAGMMAFHPVSFMSFPSQLFWLFFLPLSSCVGLHISYSIQMFGHLTFIPALHRVTAVKTEIVTHPPPHTHTHIHMHVHPHT